MNAAIEPARLYVILQKTGLQRKDPNLYQLLYNLIGNVINLTANQTGSSSGGGGGSSSTTIEQIIQLIDLGGGGSGDDGPPGPVGATGAAGSSGSTGAQGPMGNPGMDGEDGSQGELIFIPTPPNKYTGSITITTTGNIDDLDFSNYSEIRMNNASDATIRGLKAGVAGQQVRIISVGTGNVYLAPQNINSAAANRLINNVTSSTTPLAAGKGNAACEYDATTARWRLVEHNQGDFINVPYNAGDYTCNGAGTWTVDSGDMKTFMYLLVQTSLYVIGYWDATTIVRSGVDPNSLFVLIPNGFSCVNTPQQGLALGFDNGVATATFNRVAKLTSGDVTHIEIARSDTAQWANSTDNTYIRVCFAFQLL